MFPSTETQGTQREGPAALGLLRALIIGALVLLVPVVLITTNVRVAVSEKAVYDYSVRHYGAEDASGIPQSELLRANGEIRDYLVKDTQGPLSITVEDESGRRVSLFNARETAHMADVRDLVQAVFALHLFAVAALLTLAVAVVVIWPARVLAAALLSGSLLTGAVFVLAGMIALAGFDSFWTQFHLVAFSNDLWRLDPDRDHLIQMFPEDFWMAVSMLIGFVTLAQAALIAAVSTGYLFLTRDPGAETPAKRLGFLPRPRAQSRLTPPDSQNYV